MKKNQQTNLDQYNCTDLDFYFTSYNWGIWDHLLDRLESDIPDLKDFVLRNGSTGLIIVSIGVWSLLCAGPAKASPSEKTPTSGAMVVYSPEKRGKGVATPSPASTSQTAQKAGKLRVPTQEKKGKAVITTRRSVENSTTTSTSDIGSSRLNSEARPAQSDIGSSRLNFEARLAQGNAAVLRDSFPDQVEIFRAAGLLNQDVGEKITESTLQSLVSDLPLPSPGRGRTTLTGKFDTVATSCTNEVSYLRPDNEKDAFLSGFREENRMDPPVFLILLKQQTLSLYRQAFQKARPKEVECEGLVLLKQQIILTKDGPQLETVFTDPNMKTVKELKSLKSRKYRKYDGLIGKGYFRYGFYPFPSQICSNDDLSSSCCSKGCYLGALYFQKEVIAFHNRVEDMHKFGQTDLLNKTRKSFARFIFLEVAMRF